MYISSKEEASFVDEFLQEVMLDIEPKGGFSAVRFVISRTTERTSSVLGRRRACRRRERAPSKRKAPPLHVNPISLSKRNQNSRRKLQRIRTRNLSPLSPHPSSVPYSRLVRFADLEPQNIQTPYGLTGPYRRSVLRRFCS